MKVKIDYDLCMGDGNCAKVCPEVFSYDSAKLQGVVKTAEVPAEYESKVRRAASECVPGAITVE
jgi:ferredoxin